MSGRKRHSGAPAAHMLEKTQKLLARERRKNGALKIEMKVRDEHTRASIKAACIVLGQLSDEVSQALASVDHVRGQLEAKIS